MDITPEQIAHLGRLARLRVGPHEATRLGHDLTRILAYMRRLDDVASGGLQPPVASALPGGLREDEEVPGTGHDEALRGAPERAGPYFRVPLVVDHTRDREQRPRGSPDET